MCHAVRSEASKGHRAGSCVMAHVKDGHDGDIAGENRNPQIESHVLSRGLSTDVVPGDFMVINADLLIR